MKKLFLFIFVFLISINLALALDVAVDLEHNLGDMVNAQISCVGDSVLQLKNPDGFLITVDQGDGNWIFNYNTNSDQTNGKYDVKVSCSDGETKTSSFCVDSPGCVVAPANVDESGSGDGDSGDSGSTSSSSNTGGSGGGCVTRWDCSAWSVCDTNLMQSRTCVDTSRCNRQLKVEERECGPCDESWICREWDSCVNGINTRDCIDQNECGTTMQKPQERKSCNAQESGYAPNQIVNDFGSDEFDFDEGGFDSFGSDDFGSQVTTSKKSFVDENLIFIIAIPLAIVFIVILIFLVLRMKKKNKPAYNLDELKTWIASERKMKTPDSHIKEILAKQTGWSHEEIEKTFNELAVNGQKN